MGSGLVQVGSTLFTVVVITVHLQLASMLEFWTWVHHLTIWGSIGESLASPTPHPALNVKIQAKQNLS